jgi:hypothetical protein
MSKHNLPEEYALVLQQVTELGEEDFSTLAELLRFDRQRLAHIIQALHHKGLIVIERGQQFGAWIRPSAKGRQLMQFLWPEAQMSGGIA